MAVLWAARLLGLVVIFERVRSIGSLSTCTMTSGCSMDVSSGRTISFCRVFDSGNIIIHPQEGTTVQYNGESSVPCSTFSEQCMCIQLAPEIYIGIGQLDLSKMTCTVLSEGETDYEFIFIVNYKTDNSSYQSSVRVEYDGDILDSFVYVPESSYNFVLTTTKPSTVQAAVDPGYGGIVAMLLLAAALLSYFVVGMLVMRFYKGARGVEMIPNVMFWKDFPYVLKDGVMFTFLGWPCCKSVTMKSYGSL